MTNAHGLISVTQAADRLGVSGQTIRRLIAAGALPATRIGTKLLRIDPAEVERLAQPSTGAAK